MLLPIFLAIDSFLAASAIGMLPFRACRKYQICLLFGLCDGLATLVSQRPNFGTALGIFRANPWLDPISICVWLLFVGFLAYRIMANRRLGDFTVSLLPLILSIDNLLSPPFSVAHLPTALVPIAAAFFSAGFGILGVTVGTVIEGRVCRPFSIAIGLVLLGLAPILV